MDQDELELIIIEIVAFAGDARSKYLEALNSANSGNYDEAEKLIKEGNDIITDAHNVQTKLLHMEASGEKIEMGFLVVHAQDHLMTVMLLRDLVRNFINLYKKCN